jgi:hypothetical protein
MACRTVSRPTSCSCWSCFTDGRGPLRHSPLAIFARRMAELVQRALSDARELGCKVQLLSHKRHVVDGAHRLYEKLGFEPEAEGFRLYLQQVPPVVQTAQVR